MSTLVAVPRPPDLEKMRVTPPDMAAYAGCSECFSSLRQHRRTCSLYVGKYPKCWECGRKLAAFNHQTKCLRFIGPKEDSHTEHWALQPATVVEPQKKTCQCKSHHGVGKYPYLSKASALKYSRTRWAGLATAYRCPGARGVWHLTTSGSIRVGTARPS